MQTLRTDEVTTKRGALAVLAASGSGRVLISFSIALTVVRVVAGESIGWYDAVIVVGTLLLTGPVEWVIHLFLLHAPEDSFATRVLGTGTGHREHHLDPPELQWLLLRGVDAFVFTLAFSVFVAGWTVPVMWLLGGPLLGPFLTGWAMAAIGLLHYEWVHLLVHTRYRPRSRYYARLARNHRLHHFRNERYWLGVTTNSGDRLLRTYPKQKSDVPLSDTARTLGA